MSFETFMREPKAYLANHDVRVGSNASILQLMNAGAAEAIPGGQAQQWSSKPGKWVTMIRSLTMQENLTKTFADKLRIQAAKLPLVPKVGRTFVTMESPADIGFRWLQFVENHCTYMTIDGAASFAITGPLTGCTIAVGRSRTGQLVLLHANCNTQHGEGARATQWNMLSHVASRKLDTAPTSLFECRYTRDYSGMGFVFGRARQGGQWKFYGYGSDSGTRKFAEL